MRLDVLAHHRALPPVVRDAFVEHALGSTGVLGRVLGCALLRNPALPASDTLALLEDVGNRALRVAMLAQRPGLTAAEFATLTTAVPVGQLHDAWALLPAGVPEDVRTMALNACVARVGDGPSHLLHGRFAATLAHRTLDPALVGPAIRALVNADAPTRTGIYRPALVFATTGLSPDTVADLISTTSDARLRRSLETAAEFHAAAQGTSGQPSARDLFEEHLTALAGLSETDKRATLLEQFSLPDAARAVLREPSPASELVEVVLRDREMDLDVRQDALTTLWSRRTSTWQADDAIGYVVRAGDADWVNTLPSLLPPARHLLQLVDAPALTPQSLDLLIHQSLSARSGSGARELLPAYVAAHPSATTEQRERAVTFAGGGLAAEVARACAAREPVGASVAGGLLPCALFTGTRVLPRIVEDLLDAYLDVHLERQSTREHALALVALAPHFSGTVDELLSTVNDVAS